MRMQHVNEALGRCRQWPATQSNDTESTQPMQVDGLDFVFHNVPTLTKPIFANMIGGIKIDLARFFGFVEKAPGTFSIVTNMATQT